MNKVINFTTDFFVVHQNENIYNHHIYGLDLARFLKAKLAENSLVSGRIIQEDFGFLIPFYKKPFTWIAVSSLEIKKDNLITWSVFVNVEYSFWQNLFNRKNPADEKFGQQLEDKIIEILTNHKFDLIIN